VAAYCILLGRPVDPEGADYWRQQLAEGRLTSTDLVRALVESDEFVAQRRADPFRTLAGIGRIDTPSMEEPPSLDAPPSSPVSPPADPRPAPTATPAPPTDDGFRARRVLSVEAFDAWVVDRGIDSPSSITEALVHGRLNTADQRVNVAYVHLSATRGMRVSPADRGRRTVGSWANQIGADVAINGNWYAPWDGPAVSNGQVYAGDDHSYTSLFGVTESGDWIIEHHREVNDTVDPRIVEGVSGHPTLVFRGERTTDFGTDPTFLQRHPRTAIGVDATGDVLILVTVDGRQVGARGMTGAETAQLLERLGAYDAVMLDGGGSTTMWIAGRGVVNQPSGTLRAVGNEVAVFGD
jgi:hypothetical protein